MAADKKKKTTNIILAICILVVLIAVVALVLVNKDKGQEAKATEPETTTTWGDELYGIDPKVDEELADFRNVIIYGLDNKNRSDIIMIASLNEKTNKAKLVTVYRDTYMQLNDEETYTFVGGSKSYDFFKCNHAYFKGDKFVAIKELNRHMDLNCRESIGLDWETIAKLVDQVGGIEVDVTPELINLVNGGMDVLGKDDAQHLTHTGLQILNGHQAVGYLRERKDATAVQRSERNEAVFMQVFKKLDAMSTSQQMAVYDAIADDIDTNMSRNSMTDVLKNISSYDLESCGGWPNDYQIMYEQEYTFYYYVPTTLKSNVVELHNRMFGQDNYEPSDTVKDLSDQIEDLKNNRLLAQ